MGKTRSRSRLPETLALVFAASAPLLRPHGSFSGVHEILRKS